MEINVSEDGVLAIVTAECGCRATTPDQFEPCEQHKLQPDKAPGVAYQEWGENRKKMLACAEQAQARHSKIPPALYEMTKKKQY